MDDPLESSERLDELQSLLGDTDNTEEIFGKARQARSTHFGDKVFAYGFNYFSTYCRNLCTFCQYRKDNDQVRRYRNSPLQVVEDARRLADSGVHLIDLTMGEDPYYQESPDAFADLISQVRQATRLPVMISPGMVRPEDLVLFRQAGALWFALYQETFDQKAYARLRVGQDFAERLQLKAKAVEYGMLVEEGIMTGWGESRADAASSLLQMGSSHPSQVRVMTFVPQKGTPLESRESQDSNRELRMIALLRLLYPDKLIPASLDVEGPQGLEARLNAGANVITSIIPPHSGLSGVARESDIDDGGRSLSQLMPIIENAGLRLASQADYESFLQMELEEHKRFGCVALGHSPVPDGL